MCVAKAEEMKGHCDCSPIGNQINKIKDSDIWKKKLTLRCRNGHEWSSNPTNLLVGKSWCKVCFHDNKRLKIEDFYATAKHFGGTFLGFADDDYRYKNDNVSTTVVEIRQKATVLSGKVAMRPAVWRCSQGHTFTQSANNIRRSKLSARKCSWCKICRRDGWTFHWSDS